MCVCVCLFVYLFFFCFVRCGYCRGLIRSYMFAVVHLGWAQQQGFEVMRSHFSNSRWSLFDHYSLGYFQKLILNLDCRLQCILTLSFLNFNFSFNFRSWFVFVTRQRLLFTIHPFSSFVAFILLSDNIYYLSKEENLYSSVPLH